MLKRVTSSHHHLQHFKERKKNKPTNIEIPEMIQTNAALMLIEI